MANQFWVANGAVPTTASQVAVASTTSILTHIEITVPSTIEIIPVAWGLSFDGVTAGAVPGVCELFGTTVAIGSGGTAVTPTKYSNPNGPAALATAKFTAATEGAVANVRMADVQLISPYSSQYVYQWPLGREFRCAISTFLRVRIKFAAGVNVICWVQWEE